MHGVFLLNDKAFFAVCYQIYIITDIFVHLNNLMFLRIQFNLTLSYLIWQILRFLSELMTCAVILKNMNSCVLSVNVTLIFTFPPFEKIFAKIFLHVLLVLFSCIFLIFGNLLFLLFLPHKFGYLNLFEFQVSCVVQMTLTLLCFSAQLKNWSRLPMRDFLL